MRIGRFVFASFVSLFAFLICEVVALLTVIGVCTVVPGISNCGGHDKSGLVWLFALVLGMVLTWLVLARVEWREINKRWNRSQ